MSVTTATPAPAPSIEMGRDIVDQSQTIYNANLTGTPIAPTAPPGTNTTQIATTEFVLANAGAGGGGSGGAGGLSGQVQINSAGVLSGDASFVFTSSTKTVTRIGTVPSSSLPNAVGGIIGWYKADSLSLADGNPVSAWNDSSTSADNATATGTSRPIYKASVVNGNPIVRFDGIDDFMTFASRYTTIQTAFFVVRTNNLTAQQILLGDSTTYDWYADPNSPRLFGVFTSGSILGGNVYDNGLADIPLAIVKPTTFKIMAVVGTAANLHAERITNDRTGGMFWNGDFAEIILYNTALSANDFQAVLDYLSAKYAIPVANTALVINHESEWKSAGGDIHTYIDAYGDLHVPYIPKGQLLLTGDNGLVCFDASGITYDGVNKRFGINSPLPASKLEVISTDNSSTTIIAGFYSANFSQGIQIGYNSVTNLGNNDLVLQPGGGKVGVYAGIASAQLHVMAFNPNNVGFIVGAGPSAQGADFLQIQNSGTLVLFAHDKLGRPYTANTTPTLTAGVGAGTSPTVNVAGTDVNGVISITTGTGTPATASVIVTLNFSTGYGAIPKTVILTPANAAAAALVGATQVFVSGVTTTKFDVMSGSTGLAISTLYQWYYQVLG
jgi:hypothetical protein